MHMFPEIAAVAMAVMILLIAGLRLAGVGPCRRFPRLGRFEGLVFSVTMLSALYLAVTGFLATLVLGSPMEGLMLMSHTAAGGVFIVALAVLGLLWSAECRFGSAADRFDAGFKTFFWCLLTFGLATALTALVSMLSWAGTGGLDFLYEAHRWSGLLFVLALIGLGLRRRPG